MDDSFNLARHIARLFSLLMRQQDAVDQQKLELRAIVLMTREGTVRLTTRGGQLIANGLVVPQVLQGVRDLAEHMIGHGIESIEIGQDMSPGELLTLARTLVEPLTTASEVVHERIRKIEAKTIVVATEASKDEAPAPAVAVALADGITSPGSPERIEFVLRRAARGGDGEPLVPHFEEVAFAVEQATREGRTKSAVDVFARIVVHEEAATDGDVRRQFLLTIRRLIKPTILLPIARSLADDPASVDQAIAVLTRCGTDGADAVIDQYARATTAAERTLFNDVLNRIPSTDASLVTMLADNRPHAARIAAELIGERRPLDGDKSLAEHISDNDHRVRRAAIRALGSYDTPFAMDAIARGLGDAVVEVRLEAVAALASRKGARVGDIIGRAIDGEEEMEVQIGMLGALGRVGTPEAVAKLAKAAEAHSGLFSARKGAALRVAAVRALAEARTASAMSALLSLVNDKEREVRETAARAVGR